MLGEHAFAVLRVEDLEEQLLVDGPFLGRVTELGLELWAHVDVGADVVEAVDVDRHGDLVDQRPERRLVRRRPRRGSRLPLFAGPVVVPHRPRFIRKKQSAQAPPIRAELAVSTNLASEHRRY